MLNDEYKISSRHIYPSISIAQSCEVLMKKCRATQLNTNLISSSSLLYHFRVIVSVLSNAQGDRRGRPCHVTKRFPPRASMVGRPRRSYRNNGSPIRSYKEVLYSIRPINIITATQ